MKNAITLTGKHILVVEDNAINQMLARHTLTSCGADIDVCETGTKALEKLHQHSYDFILMDIHMPELDGYQTTHIIRNELKLQTPILAMTALSIHSEAEKCIQAGMNGSVPKPFTAETLHQALVNMTTVQELCA